MTRRRLTGLSARLLLLTVAFVMISEVLIYAPSIARFRQTWLTERLASAHLAALSLDASPERSVERELERRLLRSVQAYLVELRLGPIFTHMLGGEAPPRVEATYDLRDPMFLDLVADALATLAHSRPRAVHVTGTSPTDPAVLVDMIIDEAPLRAAMLEFSARILQLSVAISAITASLLYFALQWLIVRPLGRLTQAMARFREDPEQTPEVLADTGRRDEIGSAAAMFVAMRTELRAALRQKTRLAALGEAVTKINHDLRNILASAQLVSDHLAESADPEVRRRAPTVLRAIDRAIGMCSQVMAFARAGGPALACSKFVLADVARDAGAIVCPPGADDCPDWCVAVDPAIVLSADRDQLLRVLVNLGQNACEAGARSVEIAAGLEGPQVAIAVRDDGAGLPPAALSKLFQPFARSTRKSGSGLGLAIARELVLAHGGRIALARTGASGTEFRIELPLRTEPAGA